METLKFLAPKRKCDFCGCDEICANTTYGTTNYTRIICVECAMSINEHDALINGGFENGSKPFDLNKSIIRFKEVK